MALKVKRLHLRCSASLLALAELCCLSGCCCTRWCFRYCPRAAILAWEVSLLLQSPTDVSSALALLLPLPRCPCPAGCRRMNSVLLCQTQG